MSIQEKIEIAKDFFRSRKIAYEQTFNLDSVQAQAVLKDLALFCRANKTCFDADPRLHALQEGRREVWLRIMEHLKLTPDDYWDKYGRQK